LAVQEVESGTMEENSSAMLTSIERDVERRYRYEVGLPETEVAVSKKRWYLIADVTPKELD
jgi:hypothetical protein